MADDYQTAAIALELQKRYALRPRVWPVRFSLDPFAGAEPPEGVITIPQSMPFVFLEWGFGSIRPYDSRIVEIFEAGTDQNKWITKPVLVQALLGNQNAGGQPGGMRYALVEGNEKITIRIRRTFTVDPAELYPGAAIPSILDIALIGWDRLPKHGGPRGALGGDE